MNQPTSAGYDVETRVVYDGPLSWAWTTTLRQTRPATDPVLAADRGWCMTEKRAWRKAGRTGRRMKRRMKRAASSRTLRTYSAGIKAQRAGVAR